MMKAAQLRSLPVQAALTLGLFLGCVILAVLIVSQRWRFESFVKENYSAPRAELAAATQEATKKLLIGVACPDEWKQTPQLERRTAYLALMRDSEFPNAQFVDCCLKTDSEFFLTCAERTVVCGNPEQQSRGLKFLEMSGPRRAGPVLDRLTAWSQRVNRPDYLAAIDLVQQRVRTSSLD